MDNNTCSYKAKQKWLLASYIVRFSLQKYDAGRWLLFIVCDTQLRTFIIVAWLKQEYNEIFMELWKFMWQNQPL